MLTCLDSARQQKGIMVHLDSSAGCRYIAVQYFNLVQLILFLELTNKLQVATIRESWATWRLIDSGMIKWLWKEKLTFLRCYIHIGYRVIALSGAVSVLSL